MIDWIIHPSVRGLKTEIVKLQEENRQLRERLAEAELVRDQKVLVDREDLARFANVIRNCTCDCCTGNCLDCPIGKAALKEAQDE